MKRSAPPLKPLVVNLKALDGSQIAVRLDSHGQPVGAEGLASDGVKHTVKLMRGHKVSRTDLRNGIYRWGVLTTDFFENDQPVFHFSGAVSFPRVALNLVAKGNRQRTVSLFIDTKQLVTTHYPRGSRLVATATLRASPNIRTEKSRGQSLGLTKYFGHEFKRISYFDPLFKVLLTQSRKSAAGSVRVLFSGDQTTSPAGPLDGKNDLVLLNLAEVSVELGPDDVGGSPVPNEPGIESEVWPLVFLLGLEEWALGEDLGKTIITKLGEWLVDFLGENIITPGEVPDYPTPPSTDAGVSGGVPPDPDLTPPNIGGGQDSFSMEDFVDLFMPFSIKEFLHNMKSGSNPNDPQQPSDPLPNPADPCYWIGCD